MYMCEISLRQLSGHECDRVSGGIRLTTLAVGEEDGGLRPFPDRATTMAVGEEDRWGAVGTVLDAHLHI